jgi:hypothetical protein
MKSLITLEQKEQKGIQKIIIYQTRTLQKGESTSPPQKQGIVSSSPFLLK